MNNTTHVVISIPQNASVSECYFKSLPIGADNKQVRPYINSNITYIMNTFELYVY